MNQKYTKNKLEQQSLEHKHLPMQLTALNITAVIYGVVLKILTLALIH